MTNLPASRRQVIAGLAALPVVAAPAVAMAASPAADEGLAETVARYHSAQAASLKWDYEVYEPALQAYREACNAIPHFTTASAYRHPSTGEWRTFSTENPGVVGIVKDILRDRGDESWASPDTAYGRCCRELLDGHEAREHQKADLAVHHDIERLGSHSDKLISSAGEIFREIEAFPVCTLAGLVAKYHALVDADAESFEPETVLEDIERVAANSAQSGRAGL